MKKNIWKKNVILVLIVIALAVFPLYYARGSEFGGADDQAGAVIVEIAPEYEPWFEPIIEPASGEIASLLFSLQAATGSGIVFFILGRMTAKPKAAETTVGSGALGN
ncbi:MAG: energy-coupling factor ABC transporter substrate-binding protein [Oscillospiraceae bacterium]|jgi:cobalt/nickel transport protein|nr:energy-coupling factor ABC transporter substrate-binding protein [Oscillospiraceae bacterium]